jgi:hypothetical protein
MGQTAAVGDELMLKITGIFGDEIEVEYPEPAGEEPVEEEEEGEVEQPPEEAAAEDDMEGEGAPAMDSEDAYA